MVLFIECLAAFQTEGSLSFQILILNFPFWRVIWRISIAIQTDSALCCFIFRKIPIGKFNRQVSFSLALFVQKKIFEMHFPFILLIKVRVDCRLISQQIYKRVSSNLIRKKTGCDKYIEDQLNVASKTSPNICLMIKMRKFHFELIF